MDYPIAEIQQHRFGSASQSFFHQKPLITERRCRRAGAEIEHRFARFEFGECGRITTTE
jgi:hypothetical protein